MADDTGTVQVKVCGLMRPRDAAQAAAAGADYLGVILAEGFSRSVTAAEAAQVLGSVEGPTRVTVRVDDDPARIADEAALVGAGVLQLHGAETPETAARLRESTGLGVWKVVRVRDPLDLHDELTKFDGAVDGVLLEGWHPERVGGAGLTFSWEDVGRMRDRIPDSLRLIAAGGLSPANVARAVSLLRPGVVDVSSGVERSEPGSKDPDLVRAFIAAAKGLPIEENR